MLLLLSLLMTFAIISIPFFNCGLLAKASAHRFGCGKSFGVCPPDIARPYSNAPSDDDLWNRRPAAYRGGHQRSYRFSSTLYDYRFPAPLCLSKDHEVAAAIQSPKA